jgi:hypothetical protein
MYASSADLRGAVRGHSVVARPLHAGGLRDNDVGPRGAVAPAPPKAIYDERREGNRADEHQQARTAVAAEQLAGPLADNGSDCRPYRDIDDRAEQIERHELPTSDVPHPDSAEANSRTLAEKRLSDTAGAPKRVK